MNTMSSRDSTTLLTGTGLHNHFSQQKRNPIFRHYPRRTNRRNKKPPRTVNKARGSPQILAERAHQTTKAPPEGQQQNPPETVPKNSAEGDPQQILS